MNQTLSDKTVLTTGEVSKIAGVAPRTVAMWIDSGRLAGYRIPGSTARRVSRANLADFLHRYDMPTIETLLGVPPKACAACEQGGVYAGTVDGRPYCSNCIGQAELASANRKAKGGAA